LLVFAKEEGICGTGLALFGGGGGRVHDDRGGVGWWYGAADDYIFSLKMQTFPGGVYLEFRMMMLMRRIIKK